MTSHSKVKNNVTFYTFSIVRVRMLMLEITRHDIIWQHITINSDGSFVIGNIFL